MKIQMTQAELAKAIEHYLNDKLLLINVAVLVVKTDPNPLSVGGPLQVTVELQEQADEND